MALSTITVLVLIGVLIPMAYCQMTTHPSPIIEYADADEYSVHLCEKDGFEGECIVVYVPPSVCKSLNKSHYNDWVNSIDTHGKCYRLYVDTDCRGEYTAIYPGSPSHGSLRGIELNDKISAITRCHKEDYQLPKDQAVKLCDQSDFKGECKILNVPAQKCLSLNYNHYNKWANSINTFGLCYRVYKEDNCLGESIGIHATSPNHNDLKEFNFGNNISSISQCYGEHPAIQRESGDDSFFVDLATIGVLAWRQKDTVGLENSSVLYYQRHPTNNRTEAMVALIERHHLNTGTPVDERARRYANKMGNRVDKAGHILAARLGGSGTDLRNIYPQSRHLNQAAWSHIKAQVAQFVNEYGRVRVNVNLEYKNEQSTRPSAILYRVARGDASGEVLFFDGLFNPEYNDFELINKK